jgi:hypothetical protein
VYCGIISVFRSVENYHGQGIAESPKTHDDYHHITLNEDNKSVKEAAQANPRPYIGGYFCHPDLSLSYF